MTQKSARPLSPHLQVYKPQMTSITSILHRATGAALSVGLVLFTWWLVAASIGPEAYSMFTDFVGSRVGLLLMFGWTVAVYFHLANGIRHLIWDTGAMLKIKSAYTAGYFVFFFTVLASFGTWFCILTYGGISL